MARDKKTMIGFDPLAWLDDENPTSKPAGDNPLKGEQSKQKKTDSVVSRKKKPAAKAAIKSIEVLGRSLDETALLKGFDLAADVLDEVIDNFYTELLESYPDLQPLFAHTNTQQQRQKLQDVIYLLIENIHNQDVLESALLSLGERHIRYGALPEHYPVVAEILESNLKKRLGRSWTKAVSTAWIQLLSAAADVMCRPYALAQQQAEHENNDSASSVENTENAKLNVEDNSALDFSEIEAANNRVENAQHEAELTETELVVAAEENITMQDNQSILHLHNVQDISKSQALKSEILALVNDHDAISIDGSNVERIDGSALQLLCSLFQYARDNSMSLQWIEPSDSLVQSADVLGIKQLLELNA